MSKKAKKTSLSTSESQKKNSDQAKTTVPSPQERVREMPNRKQANATSPFPSGRAGEGNKQINTKSPFPSGRAGEGRKHQIISTAAKLFKEKGYSAVTMRDLATEMGIKAASLYNHINSKQDILKAIVISIAEDFTEGMDAIIKSKQSNISKLKQIVELHVDIAVDNTDGMAALNNDWMHLEDQLDYYLKLRAGYETNFMSIIIQGMQNSEIKESNPEIIMFSMLTTLRSLHLWIPKKELLNTKDLARNLSEVLIEGFNR